VVVVGQLLMYAVEQSFTTLFVLGKTYIVIGPLK